MDTFRRVTLAMSGLTAALFILLLLPGWASAQPKLDLGLDHFKCYFTRPDKSLFEPVRLEDQFDAADKIVEDVRVLVAVRFCNPVKKIRGGQVTSILNPDHHLTLYLIAPTAPTPARLVMVKNQFGVRKLKVFDPEVLAVPTQKAPHPPPVGLDHFKCYRTYGTPINTVVSLEDQFHREPEVRVVEPFGLCNPVEKEHPPESVTPIKNPKAHLVCYKITPTPITKILTVVNQFGPQTLVVRDADLLCVPSEKRVL